MANEDVRVVCKEGVYVSDSIMLGDCRGEKFETLAKSLNYKSVHAIGTTTVFAKDGVAVVYNSGSAVVIGNEKTMMYTSEIVKAIQESQKMTAGRSPRGNNPPFI